VGGFIRQFYKFDPSGLDGFYQADCCLQCGLIFQRQIGDTEMMRFIYGELVADDPPDKIPTFQADIRDWKGSRDAHELMALSSFLNKPKLKVLDYGTGWGLWSIIASKLGHRAYAIELAPERAAWVSTRGVTMISDDQISNHRFDVINLEQVLEHVPEPANLLERLVGSLDGILKLSLPDAGHAPAILASMKAGESRYEKIMPVQPLEHINSFSRKALLDLASRLRLREVRPSLRDLYSFIPGGIPSGPRRIAKELIRPFWTWRNPANLYVWLIRD
jgi:methyltransferase family protein